MKVDYQIQYYMLKFGKEIGISPISGIKIDKFPDKAIRSFYKINNILYSNAKCYISPSMGEKILAELSAQTIDFKETEVGVLHQDTKEELLEILRKKYRQLKQYVKTFTWSEEDETCVIKTINYQLSTYLKDKDKIDIEKTLKRNHEVWKELYLPFPNHEKINTKQFEKMQKELLVRLNEPYQLCS